MPEPAFEDGNLGSVHIVRKGLRTEGGCYCRKMSEIRVGGVRIGSPAVPARDLEAPSDPANLVCSMGQPSGLEYLREPSDY